MLIGAFLGVTAGITFVAMATPDCGGGPDAANCYEWLSYAFAGGLLVAGFLLGSVFVRIVGSATTFMILGGAIATIVALVNGLWLRVPGFALTTLASWVVSHGQKARLDAQYGIYQDDY